MGIVNLVLRCAIFSGIFPNQLFREINCISLSTEFEFGANVFHSLVEKRFKTENRLSTFPVGRAVNTEIFLSSNKFPFCK